MRTAGDCVFSPNNMTLHRLISVPKLFHIFSALDRKGDKISRVPDSPKIIELKGCCVTLQAQVLQNRGKALLISLLFCLPFLTLEEGPLYISQLILVNVFVFLSR